MLDESAEQPTIRFADGEFAMKEHLGVVHDMTPFDEEFRDRSRG
jgi:hypothetical protein